jgi:hypothetical protein
MNPVASSPHRPPLTPIRRRRPILGSGALHRAAVVILDFADYGPSLYRSLLSSLSFNRQTIQRLLSSPLLSTRMRLSPRGLQNQTLPPPYLSLTTAYLTSPRRLLTIQIAIAAANLHCLVIIRGRDSPPPRHSFRSLSPSCFGENIAQVGPDQGDWGDA